jgi:hypothetical protein
VICQMTVLWTDTLHLMNRYSTHPVGQIFHNYLPKLVVPNPRTGEWQVLGSAETGKGRDEFFATPFLRDTAIFELGLLDAIEHGATDKEAYLRKAITALAEIERYQATEDQPEVGTKQGQMPHELRFPFLDKRRKEPNPLFRLYVDSHWPVFQRITNGTTEEYTANYDAADATHLYVLLVMRLQQRYPGFATEEGRPERLRLACEYILRNSQQHNYLAGFVNDSPWNYLLEEEEAYGGLPERYAPHLPNSRRTSPGMAYREIRDQGDQCFPNGLKFKPGYPISGLETTAVKYVAEMTAADFYEKNGDTNYAAVLREDARRTKLSCNSESTGFLRRDAQGDPYFIEARGINPETESEEQLPYKTASPIYALAYTYVPYSKGGKPATDRYGKLKLESVIEDRYISDQFKLIMQDLYQPGFGISTYSKNQVIPAPRGVRPTGYWISEGTTFWSVEQFLAANALWDFGYEREALEIGINAGKILEGFGSPIENWVRTQDGRIEIWRHPFAAREQVAACAVAHAVGPGLGFEAKVNKRIAGLHKKTGSA